jgi:3-oxoacyl-[acyl-carrier protein] reductase
MFSFRPQISAVVCGASQGIGKQVALQLAQNNIRVLAVARNPVKLAELKKELLTISNLEHDTISCDFSDSNQLEKLSLRLLKDSFQILVCNSGGPKSGPLAQASVEELNLGFQSHVIANQKLVQSVLPAMKQAMWGRIINIISTSVKIPIPNLGVSNTIRGAVAQWSKTLSLELGPLNITVNNVLPGYTATERLDELLKAASNSSGKSIEETTEDWKSKVPLKRFAGADEVASAVSFLCSSNADYISGINLPVDGGRTGAL